MDLRLYDTLTREKRTFEPLDWQDAAIPPEQKRVRLYACGPTVYDFVHIGNGRMAVVFDVLFRMLRHAYGADRVLYVRNVTDVDDKINARAAERGIAIRDLTEETYRHYREDVAALGCLRPTVEAARHRAHRRHEGVDRTSGRVGSCLCGREHVLFDVPAMPDYGRLSRRSLDELIAGARVDVAPYKRDPQDFVLWKPSRPGEPAWPSPAGIRTPGRPGWHIECSAMSWRHLGETFDIHGGGIDLVFPHHENEIAQSRCAFHTPFMARTWMHNGFLQVQGEKMSKSLGNFVTIHDLRQDWPGEAIRLALLQTHYRQPLPWTEAGLREAKHHLDAWYELTAGVEPGLLCADVMDALTDDLNTPKALAALHELKSEAAKGTRPAAACLKASAQMLGLLQLPAAEWRDWRPQSLEIDEARVTTLIAARNAARKARNFAEADRIRDELAAMRIELKDSKDGTTWQVAP